MHCCAGQDKWGRRRQRSSKRSSPAGICLPLQGEENEIFQCSISVANSITVGTCSKRCSFQEAEIENLAANEMANH